MSGPLDAYDIPEPANLPLAQPEASLGDVWRASRDLAAGDVSVAGFRRDRAAWEPVVDALGLHPSQNPAYYDNSRFGKPTRLKPAGTFFYSYVGRDEQEELILARLRERRAQDPAFLKDVPDTVAGFRQWVIQREQQRRAGARSILNRSPGGIVAGAVELGGAAVEGFTDPINIMTLPVGGGGKTLGGILLRETLVNAGLEAAQQPLVALNRAELGEELTLGEAATNVALSGIFGGVLETGVTAGARQVTRAIDAATPMEKRLANALGDAELPAIARETIGYENLTPTARAAVNVIEREAEIEATSPFAKGGPSVETHGERLAATIQQIVEENITLARRPQLTPTTVTGRIDGLEPAAPRAPAVEGSGFERYMRRVGNVESGGSATARNPRSSAEGVYQFTDATWLAYYKRRYGTSGLTDAGILAKKRDRGLQDQLMRDLTADNARELARAGEAESAGNLYLAHFAGPKGAVRILKAEAETPLERVLSADAITANPFLRGKTAGDLVEWAHRKMGEPGFAGQRVSIDRSRFAPTEAGETEWRAAQAAIDAEIMARLAAERSGTSLAGDRPGSEAIEPIAVDQDLTPWTRDDVDGQAPTTITEPPAPDPAVVEILPAVRQAIQTPGLSLDPARLAKSLQTTEAVARAALQSIAARSRAVLVDKNGRFRRPLQRKDEPDIITWVADRGGVRDEMTMSGRYGAHDMKERLKAFVPGAGALHRKTGMSLDELGEALWEDGWFLERPSTADVLDLLERGVAAYGGPKAKRIYHPERRAEAVAAAERAGADEELLARINDNAGDLEFGDDELQRIAADVERYLGRGNDVDDAIAAAIDDEIAFQVEFAQRQALFDNEEELYKAIAELEAEGYVGSSGRVGGEDSGQSEVLGGDPGAGREGGQDGDGLGQARADELDAQGLGPLEDLGAYRAFDDPAGDGATAQIESIEHDVRMDVAAALDQGAAIDPAIAERNRQLAQLGAEAPLRGGNKTGAEQDGTMGLGLFDAADQPGFRLSEEGDERQVADLLRELDDDDAANAVLRGCMVPPKGGDA